MTDKERIQELENELCDINAYIKTYSDQISDFNKILSIEDFTNYLNTKDFIEYFKTQKTYIEDEIKQIEMSATK